LVCKAYASSLDVEMGRLEESASWTWGLGEAVDVGEGYVLVGWPSLSSGGCMSLSIDVQ
jgi:hypothetical protein